MRLIESETLKAALIFNDKTGEITAPNMREVFRVIDSQPPFNPWHRVEERLPPMLYQAEGDDFCIDYSLIVLAYREASHDFYLARQMDDGHGATWGTDCFDELYGVTHWMPLPEPPMEEN